MLRKSISLLEVKRSLPARIQKELSDGNHTPPLDWLEKQQGNEEHLDAMAEQWTSK